MRQRLTDRQIQTGRQTDGQTDRQRDRQTEKGEATFECETNKEAAAVKWLKGTKAIVGDDR